MALTERPDVISLAGGLPDTSTFAPALYAKLMGDVAAESTARALQYGPTEGMAATVRCIAEVMDAEGTKIDPSEVIVTTGGQQVIDLVCKTLIDRGGGADLPGRRPHLQRLPGAGRADSDRW
jgi:2-aminoadipate transaminase